MTATKNDQIRNRFIFGNCVVMKIEMKHIALLNGNSK
jgi:hypothetical protein